MSRRTAAVAAALSAAVLLTGFGPPPDPDSFTAADLARSVSPLNRNVNPLGRNVQAVAIERTEGPDGVVALSSDILFVFGSAELSERAAAKIREIVTDVPRRAKVFVSGHTDSIGTAAYNKRLSTQRAKAVAAAIQVSRTDLRLDVRGYGETRPIASNGSGGNDNPEGRAKNRRVELRYRA